MPFITPNVFLLGDWMNGGIRGQWALISVVPGDVLPPELRQSKVEPAPETRRTGGGLGEARIIVLRDQWSGARTTDVYRRHDRATLCAWRAKRSGINVGAQSLMAPPQV